jgi:hypothetical protein
LVIVDPALTISRIYMYFYLMINLGSLLGQVLMTYSEKARQFASLPSCSSNRMGNSTLASGLHIRFQQSPSSSAPSS